MPEFNFPRVRHAACPIHRVSESVRNSLSGQKVALNQGTFSIRREGGIGDTRVRRHAGSMTRGIDITAFEHDRFRGVTCLNYPIIPALARAGTVRILYRLRSSLSGQKVDPECQLS